jgi:thioredoxin reductase (NADPH)
METTDVLVVGAGPIGIEMAVALTDAGLSFLHLEARQIGATIEWYAPQTHFFSSPERIQIAGVPLQTLDQSKATREEYLLYLRTVVQQFDLAIRTHEPVVGLTPLAAGGFEVTSEARGARRQIQARRVVLAIGDMHRPRRLGIPGEDLPHVSHYFADPHTYFRKRVLIVGGKNSAVEAAIRCRRVGARATLSYRRPSLRQERIKFWLWPEIQAMLREGQARLLEATVPREIRPDAVVLERVAADDPTVGTGEFLEEEADFVLLLTGYEQDSTLYEMAGVTLEGPGRRPHHNLETMETDVPGLYVAGTGSAGTQLEGVKEFIETSHIHVRRILAHLKGETTADLATPSFELPES